MKIFVLTSEYNDYDQHGEYFEAAFKDKPTSEQLINAGVPLNTANILAEGGAIHWGYKVYILTEYELQ